MGGPVLNVILVLGLKVPFFLPGQLYRNGSPDEPFFFFFFILNPFPLYINIFDSPPPLQIKKTNKYKKRTFNGMEQWPTLLLLFWRCSSFPFAWKHRERCVTSKMIVKTIWRENDHGRRRGGGKKKTKKKEDPKPKRWKTQEEEGALLVWLTLHFFFFTPPFLSPSISRPPF